MSVSESIINSWERVVENVRTSGGIGPSHMGFLDLARPQGLIANTLLLAVPNEMTRDILENQLHEHLTDALTEVFGTDINCAYSIDTNMHTAAPEIPVTPARPAQHEAAVDNVVNISGRSQQEPEYSPNEPLMDELFSSRTNPAATPLGGPQQTVPPNSGERSRLNEHYHFDTSSLAPPTVSPTPLLTPFPNNRPSPITHCLSTVNPVWVKPTCYTPLATTPKSFSQDCVFAT